MSLFSRASRKSKHANADAMPEPVKPPMPTRAVMGRPANDAGLSLAFFGQAGADANTGVMLGDDDDGLPTRGQTMASGGALATARAKAVAAKASVNTVEAFVCNDCGGSFDAVEDGDFDHAATGLSDEEEYPWYCTACWEAEFDLNERYPTSVEIVAVKRYKPAKHYTYSITVTWDDKSSATVYRKYSDFFDLHTKLLAEFPVAAGEADAMAADRGGGRLLPYLPGKAMMGKANTKKTVQSSTALLSQYLTVLCSLGPPSFPAEDVAVAQSHTFALFCFTTDNDLAITEAAPPPAAAPAAAPAAPTSATGVSSAADGGDEEEDGNGELGPELEQYWAVAAFTAENPGEISFEAGAVLSVVEKNDVGWWFCRKDGDAALEGGEGWAPATYLNKGKPPGPPPAPATAGTAGTAGTPDVAAVAAAPTPVAAASEITIVEDGAKFVAIMSYEADQVDEIGCEVGTEVTVKERRLDGWWKIEVGDKSGWAPGGFFQEVKARTERTLSAVRQSWQDVRSAMSVKRGRLPSVGTHGGGGGGGEMAAGDDVKVTRRIRSLSVSVKAAPPRRNTILME